MTKACLKYLLVFLLVFMPLERAAVYACAAPSDENQLVQHLKEYIEENSLHHEDCVRIELLSRIPSLENDPGGLTWQITGRPGEEYIGDTSFNVRIFKNGVFLKEETIRVRIEVLRDFVVSLKAIAKSSIITDEDVTVQKKWVRRIPANSISCVDEVTGKNIAVSLRPHAQITRNMLREVKTVRKGKMVQVVADNGLMRIVMNGLAEEDGADDTVIKVRNLNSNKIIYARVVGPSRVQVDF
jgi:flagella basal body P-ring formation protein FlgA